MQYFKFGNDAITRYRFVLNNSPCYPEMESKTIRLVRSKSDEISLNLKKAKLRAFSSGNLVALRQKKMKYDKNKHENHIFFYSLKKSLNLGSNHL